LGYLTDLEGAMKLFRPAFVAAIVVLTVWLLLSPSGGSAAIRDQDPIPFPVWRHEVVDPGVAFFYLGVPSLALDHNNEPHVVYGQNGLFHSWRASAGWQTETLVPPPAFVGQSAIAINPDGKIIVVYETDGQVFARTRSPGWPWSAATRLPLPAGLRELSLALDSEGKAHVAAGFIDSPTESTIYLAAETDAGWVVEPVGAGYLVSAALRLALDSHDRPVLLYGQAASSPMDNTLWLARRDDGGVWQREAVAEGCIIASKALALDPQDVAHVVYSEHCDRRLTYARELASGWDAQPLADDGVWPGLALDDAGRPHVVYGDLDTGQVYAVLTDAGWDKTVLRPGTSPELHNTLLLDAGGAAHIAAIDGELFYTTYVSGALERATVAAPETNGGRNALALDSTDTPYVFYDKAEAGELWWGARTAGGWTTDKLAEVSILNLEVAAAVDTQDRPHVAYLDAGAKQLVVGAREAGAWSLETVDDDAAGTHLALAIGSDDAPHMILVRDAKAYYWYKDGDAWHSEAAPWPNEMVSNAWLALDSQNRPHVAYTGGTGVIYAVRQPDGLWAVETTPFSYAMGLALGPGDKRYLLHVTANGGRAGGVVPEVTLWLAERDGAAWTETPVASESEWPTLWATLAVDGQGGVYVLYRDVYGFLHLQQRDAAGDWQTVNEAWGTGMDSALLVGHDDEPRLLTSYRSSLILWSRETLLLDRQLYLPIVMKN
jgi:hypothetical protein